MPGPTRRKKTNIGQTSEKKKFRTKRRTRDIDLIVEDLETPEKRRRLENQPVDLDLPGAGQFYCIHCARHFINQPALDEHKRSKGHKKRVKDTLETPYTIEESLRAAGQGSYIPPIKKIKENNMDIESEPVSL